MYEKLVKRLRNRANGSFEVKCEGCEFTEDFPPCVHCTIKAFIDAADAIEELSKLADAIPHVCECCVGCELEKKNGGCDNAFVLSQKRAMQYLIKPRWIPVAERLPEERINPNTQDFEYVLCVTIWGDVRPFKYGTPIGHREAHFWNGAGYVDAYVTHWMPLPQPPKEET